VTTLPAAHTVVAITAATAACPITNARKGRISR
jgi:hypothetical protein